MIVRATDAGIELITQPDHAHLAGRIMEHCVPLDASPRRQTILLAIREHDSGWDTYDASPTVDPATGAVVDFVSAPLSVRHGVWPRSVARLEADPYAAALVAEHAITVYDRYRVVPEWRSFFVEMQRARDAMRRASGVAQADFDDGYAYVRLADLISLTFCTGWSDVQRFGPWSVRRDATRVVVTPDVFGGAAIPSAIRAKAVAKRTFQSNDELGEALNA